MAKFNILLALMALLLLVATGLAEDDIAPSELDNDDDYEDISPFPQIEIDGTVAQPPMPQEEAQLLAACTRIVGPECGTEIFQAVFLGNIVSDIACCQKLLRAGQSCSDGFIRAVFQYNEVDLIYPDVDLNEAIKRSGELFSVCSSLVELAPAPSV
ncbi:hypothetical protein Tsubulata_003464 [Turnera subulata]|uniref:Prolamin-like domain-containing protein n=1 Tax=Turnera subulata TaxID=218843 RepID=A0A9Q0G9L6_9ROSI|nr:hypothetical protein Tsubulata_003464 [Turnera subulata]